MNIIEELYFFNKDELFFKKYYFLDKTKQNIEYFYKENQNDATNLNIALHPESLPIYHYEDDFISIKIYKKEEIFSLLIIVQHFKICFIHHFFY